MRVTAILAATGASDLSRQDRYLRTWVNLIFGALFRTLFSKEQKDQIGKGLFWAFGVPMLVIILGGFLWIAAKDGGLPSVLGLLGAIAATLTGIVVVLALLAKTFMAIGTRLEGLIGDGAASVVSLAIVVGIVVVAFNLVTFIANGGSAPKADELDPTQPMTEAECKLYVIVHPEYECVLAP